MLLIFTDGTALLLVWTVQTLNSVDQTHLVLLDSTTKIHYKKSKDGNTCYSICCLVFIMDQQLTAAPSIPTLDELKVQPARRCFETYVLFLTVLRQQVPPVRPERLLQLLRRDLPPQLSVRRILPEVHLGLYLPVGLIKLDVNDDNDGENDNDDNNDSKKLFL